MISARFRCVTCDQVFADLASSPCSNCGSVTWEPCVVDTDPTGKDAVFVHHTGVAFFAYDEAASAGIDPPAWAAATVPAASNAARRLQLEQRMDQALGTNTTFLALTSPTNAQVAAQVKALTRQVSAIIRLERNQLGALD